MSRAATSHNDDVLTRAGTLRHPSSQEGGAEGVVVDDIPTHGTRMVNINGPSDNATAKDTLADVTTANHTDTVIGLVPPKNSVLSRDYATTTPVIKRLVTGFQFKRSSTEPGPSKATSFNVVDLEKGTTTSTPHNASATANANANAGGALSAANRASALANLLEPQKKLKPPPTWKTSGLNIVRYSWLNVLLLLIPASFACANAHVGSTATFCVSFGAIIPLAALLGFATEELAIRVGHTLGGLMNATLGNTVELIIAILALVKGELRIVQASMIGSILSNCLLVLGCCFFAGGIRFHEQVYTIRAAQLNSGLLGMSALVIVIPAAYNLAIQNLNSGANAANTEASTDNDILQISRGVAIILLFVYGSFLFFQFWTHAYLYAANRQHVRRSKNMRARSGEEDEPLPPEDVSVLRVANMTWRTRSHSSSSGDDDTSSISTASDDDDEKGVETPKLKVQAAIVLILCVTALTGVVAEYLVESIDGLVQTGNISREFVALILLPLVGNAAEHVSAVTVSVKDKLDLSISIAVGSSIQIALFVLPLLILLGWCIGQPLSLEFDVLETIVLFISIVIVNQAVGDGRSNWLEGLTLMITYLVIAVSFFYYPGAGSIA